MGSWDDLPLTRRAYLRTMLAGAAGLSLLPLGSLSRLLGRMFGQKPPQPTCYAPPPPTRTCYVPVRPGGQGGPSQSTLQKWAELGAIWRQMSIHRRLGHGGPADERKFKQLKNKMETALNTAKASPELRLAFEERWSHISRLVYPSATCYKMASPAPSYDAVRDMESQVAALEDLVRKGVLTPNAAEKAARVLAVDLEVLLRDGAAPIASPNYSDAARKLDADRKAGKVKPRPGAYEAGERLAEMTVDKPGMLIEPPDGQKPKTK
jgi:hypothetical protein